MLQEEKSTDPNVKSVKHKNAISNLPKVQQATLKYTKFNENLSFKKFLICEPKRKDQNVHLLLPF